MPDTTTSNLGLTKPEIGASADSWGNKLNADLDLVDALFAAAGTGTSVGVNVGAGKTIAVAGTLNVTGTVSGGIVAPLASPTFTGTVVLPSTTSIGPVSSTEIGYLDNVTSNVQTQLDAKLGTATAASTYAPLASPSLTGVPTAPTAAASTSTTQIATTAFVDTSFAKLASPAFTGTPTAPTAASGTNTTQVASTAFVQQVALNNQLPLQTGNTGKYLTTNGTNASWAAIPAGVTSVSFGTTGLTPATATNGDVVVAGTLGVANGGTGAATLTANAVLIGNGTSAVSAVAPGSSGNVLTSNGTAWTSAAPPSSAVNYPQNAQTSAYTLALSDQGKQISITTGGVAIPANSSVAFPVGSVVCVFNNSSSVQYINITSDTLYHAGASSTGVAALAQRGFATCVKVDSTAWVV